MKDNVDYACDKEKEASSRMRTRIRQRGVTNPKAGECIDFFTIISPGSRGGRSTSSKRFGNFSICSLARIIISFKSINSGRSWGLDAQQASMMVRRELGVFYMN